MTTPQMVDVIVQDHGTVVTFDVRSMDAATWVDEHVQTEDRQWMGSRLTVDWRFAEDLMTGMRDAGLEVA